MMDTICMCLFTSEKPIAINVQRKKNAKRAKDRLVLSSAHRVMMDMN